MNPERPCGSADRDRERLSGRRYTLPRGILIVSGDVPVAAAIRAAMALAAGAATGPLLVLATERFIATALERDRRRLPFAAGAAPITMLLVLFAVEVLQTAVRGLADARIEMGLRNGFHADAAAATLDRVAGSRFSTDVLDRAIERRQRTVEQFRAAMRERLVQTLEAAPVPVEEAIIFGSIERAGHFDTTSDIDVAVGALPARDYFTLKSHLEHSLGREVDLVDLDRCHFAATIRRTGTKWTRRDT